jgi:hypothetical protein
MNDTEREAIILNSAWEMIDGMMNWAVFVKTDSAKPSNLIFQTSAHARLFVILLSDFLSEIRAFKGEPIPLDLKPVPSNSRPSGLTFLFHLRQVCADPKFGVDAAELSATVEAFAIWLDGEFTATGVNLRTIDVVADLRVARHRYIKMCGDMAKHNLARLATNVGHLRRLLEQAGHPVDEQRAYLAVEAFFEWFHQDIFVFHASQIGEFLNNIRWAIYEYLQPEFRRSWHVPTTSTAEFPMYMFEERTPTLRFLASWGSFQLCYGIVMANYFRDGDELNRLRTALKGGHAVRVKSERQKQFFAALIALWMDRGKTRQFAERHVARSIEEVIARSALPAEFEKEWFESLLAEKSREDELPRLRDAYTRKRITGLRLRELAARPRVNIPALDGFLPTARLRTH